MLKRLNINWNARQLAKMCMNGSITFDNAVQRGYVWDVKRKSLLIDSMLTGYPVPPFYAKRDESKVFDMLDGKQRSEAICGFFNGAYALEGVSEEYEGMYFNDLPEDVKDELISYSLTVYYFEDITDDEVNEMFFRLNNGKALTAIELTRVKAKSIEKIKELSTHPIFRDALKESQINKYTNEDIVIKALVMLVHLKPDLTNKFIRPFITEVEISEQQAEDITNALNQIMQAHEILIGQDNVKAAKKLYTRTHLISMIPLALKAHKNNVSTLDFAAFINYFFTPETRGVTVSSVYNAHSTSGSNGAYAVEMRDRELKEHYKRFMEDRNGKNTD